MSNLLDQIELDGLREDFFNMLGIFDEGGDEMSISQAKTLVTINRVIERGDINQSTKKYDNPSITSIYAGPAHISPVTYRRDRQELGGEESIRIRQYRCILPWDAGNVLVDDFCTINFSSDPEMVGKVFDITDILYESQMVVRRISMVDTTKNISGLEC